MMTQLQSLSTDTELDDLALWHAHVSDAITAADDIGAIFGATARIAVQVENKDAAPTFCR